jgi:hypothetical protein
VRRCLAVFAALSLFALQAQSLAFHVHAVSDHDHDEDHQHGPAIHHHDDVDSALHVDEPDPSTDGSVLTMAVPAATATSADVTFAEATESLHRPDLQLIGDARTIEVRSHGPPQRRTDSPRGPPTSLQS